MVAHRRFGRNRIARIDGFRDTIVLVENRHAIGIGTPASPTDVAIAVSLGSVSPVLRLWSRMCVVTAAKTARDKLGGKVSIDLVTCTTR